jgi:hypothetical protein
MVNLLKTNLMKFMSFYINWINLIENKTKVNYYQVKSNARGKHVGPTLCLAACSFGWWLMAGAGLF